MFESSEGRHAEATRVAAAAAALRAETGVTGELMSRSQVDVTQVARREIGEEAVERGLADGRAMTLDEAIEYARSLPTSMTNHATETWRSACLDQPISKCHLGAVLQMASRKCSVSCSALRTDRCTYPSGRRR
jgi:hypothetical protein